MAGGHQEGASGPGLAGMEENPDHGFAYDASSHQQFMQHWHGHLKAAKAGLQILNVRVSGHADNNTHQNMTLAMALQRNLNDAFSCFKEADGHWQKVQAMINARQQRIAELLV